MSYKNQCIDKFVVPFIVWFLIDWFNQRRKNRSYWTRVWNNIIVRLYDGSNKHILCTAPLQPCESVYMTQMHK